MTGEGRNGSPIPSGPSVPPSRPAASTNLLAPPKKKQLGDVFLEAQLPSLTCLQHRICPRGWCSLVFCRKIAGSFNKVPAVFPFPEPIPHEVPRRHRGLTIEMRFLGFLGISCILIMKLKCNEMHELVTLCCPMPFFLLCWHVVVSVLVFHSARAQVPGSFFAVIRFAGSPDRPRRAGNPSTTVLGPAMPWNNFDLFFVNVIYIYIFCFFLPHHVTFFCLGPSQLRFLHSSMSSWIKHNLGFSTW